MHLYAAMRRCQIEASMKKYPASPDKIVLGLPWYAYDFVCAEGTSPTERNCNATADFEGHFSYFGALQVLQGQTTGTPKFPNLTVTTPREHEHIHAMPSLPPVSFAALLCVYSVANS